MGLNYSYVLLIKRSDEESLINYISQQGSVEHLAEPLGTCIILDFPLDEVITDYLKRTIRDRYGDSWNWRLSVSNKSKHRDYFPTDNTGRIGCIYLEVKQATSEGYSFICFTAATSSMSVLFQNSPSIKSWFLRLSSIFNATTFLDLEEQGYYFIYRQGHTITAILNEDLEIIQASDIDRQAVADVCQDYAKWFLA